MSLGVSISCLFLGSGVCGAGPCYYRLLCMGSGKKEGLWEPPEETEQVPRYPGLRPGSLGSLPCSVPPSVVESGYQGLVPGIRILSTYVTCAMRHAQGSVLKTGPGVNRGGLWQWWGCQG